MAVAQKLARSAVAARPARSAVVVRASAEQSRRAVLGGLVAGAALSLAKGAQATATSINLIDDRKAVDNGFNLIYEARNLELPQNERDGLTQFRSDIAVTKSRVKESEARLDEDLEPFIKKNYWTEAREQLRRQVGTLRFDLNTLASAKGGKEDKKKALALGKVFIKKVEDLDFSLRAKDEASALKALEVSKKALDDVLAFVL